MEKCCGKVGEWWVFAVGFGCGKPFDVMLCRLGCLDGITRGYEGL